MAEKLDRKSWAKAVKNHREGRPSPSSTTEEKKAQSLPLTSQLWQERVRNSRQMPGGGRHRALVKPSNRKPQRKMGGMLRSSIPRGRKEISEAQRQALPKTGHLVPKKGINASNWAYDHRKATSARREKASSLATSPKKGINAEKWHYDHQKVKASERKTMGKPTTHVSAEKKLTQSQAIAKHQPKQPKRSERPKARPTAKSMPVTKKK